MKPNNFRNAPCIAFYFNFSPVRKCCKNLLWWEKRSRTLITAELVQRWLLAWNNGMAQHIINLNQKFIVFFCLHKKSRQENVAISCKNKCTSCLQKNITLYDIMSTYVCRFCNSRAHYAYGNAQILKRCTVIYSRINSISFVVTNLHVLQT